MRIVLLLLLAACGPKNPADAPVAGAAPADTDAENAPPPYTAEQIAAAFPVGLKVHYAITTPEGTVQQHWEVIASDATAMTMRERTVDPAGVEAPPTEYSATWAELVSHATFPASATVRTDSKVEVPAGRFDTWRYEVQAEGEHGQDQLHVYEFARDLAGPPVWYTVTEGGDEIFRMELVSRDPMIRLE